ncbi:hypothetical protein ZWY2020_030816 [Hordeum vulgare]|nr:hypothetical protein ZWY2020_030816 [Hordeum vulgare]
MTWHPSTHPPIHLTSISHPSIYRKKGKKKRETPTRSPTTQTLSQISSNPPPPHPLLYAYHLLPIPSLARIFHSVRGCLCPHARTSLRVRRHHRRPRRTTRLLYYTSLGVIWGTSGAAPSAIPHGLHASVDERDLAMDACYLEELTTLLLRARRITFPSAEELCHLHESGQLRRVAAGATSLTAYGRCGGERCVLCCSCDRRHKRYSLKGGGVFCTCTGCNKNGLVRSTSTGSTSTTYLLFASYAHDI